MAINAEELNKDFKEFAVDGTVKTVEDADLDHWWHGSQEDSFAGENSTNVKGFFDFIPRRVFLPWLNVITNVLNALKSTVTKNKTDGDEALNVLKNTVTKNKTDGDEALNVLKNTVETEYLKSERVQHKYDPESAEPLSGKAVREAVELEGVDTVWEGFRKIGGYLEARGDQFWHMSLVNDILHKVQSGDFESNVEGWSGNVKIFVRNLATDQIYFISGSEAMKVIMGNLEEPKPIYDPATTKKKVLDSLFPIVESREDITSQAGSYALPSDDVKIECEIDWGGQTTGRYIYMATPSFSSEPMMYIKDGITSPFLFPDDFADQEMAATYWKAGNIFEAGISTKATLITKKNQIDRRAISPSRLKELIEAATETKTIYIPVARNNDGFTLTEEMKENGLVIRRNATHRDYISACFTIYSPSGDLLNETTSIDVPEEAGGVIPFDVSRHGVGSQIQFFSYTDYQYGGNAEVQMPVAIRSLSSERLAMLIAEEVSEE